MYYTKLDLKDRFNKLGYSWESFHLIGVRSKQYIQNTFCDRFYLIANNEIVLSSKATTRPGSYYLMNLINPEGTAILKPGQYKDTFMLGKHRGKYTAWTQAKPVSVYRDSDKDLIPELQSSVKTGYFGINIHRSSEFTVSKLVDKWSAGCQVFDNPENFRIFIELSKKSNQKLFTYTLLDEF